MKLQKKEKKGHILLIFPVLGKMTHIWSVVFTRWENIFPFTWKWIRWFSDHDQLICWSIQCQSIVWPAGLARQYVQFKLLESTVSSTFLFYFPFLQLCLALTFKKEIFPGRRIEKHLNWTKYFQREGIWMHLKLNLSRKRH